MIQAVHFKKGLTTAQCWKMIILYSKFSLLSIMKVVGLNFRRLLLSFVVWVGISTGGSPAEENLDKALAKSIAKMTKTVAVGR